MKAPTLLIGVLLFAGCSAGKHTIADITLSKTPDTTSEWVGKTTRRFSGWGDAHVEIVIIGDPSGPKPEQKKLLQEVLSDFDRFFVLAATEIVKDDGFFKSLEHLKQRTLAITLHCDAEMYEVIPKWSLLFAVLAEGDHEMGMFAEFEGKRFVEVTGAD